MTELYVPKVGERVRSLGTKCDKPEYEEGRVFVVTWYGRMDRDGFHSVACAEEVFGGGAWCRVEPVSQSPAIDETKVFKVGDRVSGIGHVASRKPRVAASGIISVIDHMSNAHVVESDGFATMLAADSLRHEPAHEKWEPRVGELCDGVQVYYRTKTRGTFHNVGTWGGKPAAWLVGADGGSYVDIDSLSPVEKLDSGTAKQPPVLRLDAEFPKPRDPYKTDPLTWELPNGKSMHGFVAWQQQQTGIASGLSKKEQAKAQLGSAQVFRTATGKVVDRYGSPLGGLRYDEAWASAQWESD